MVSWYYDSLSIANSPENSLLLHDRARNLAGMYNADVTRTLHEGPAELRMGESRAVDEVGVHASLSVRGECQR